MLTDIMYAVMAISGLGLLLGVGLGYAGKIFAVSENEQMTLIRAALPGANCGGCGYAGCDLLADAIFRGEAKPNGCPVGGSKCAAEIAGILGVDAENAVPLTAYVKCVGGSSKASNKYEYVGLSDCRAAGAMAGGGAKGCKYGCLGLGSCVQVCKFDAINIVDDIAVVDEEKCVACGECVRECPRRIIEIVPADKEVRVACNSNDAGKVVREYCQTGCISCKLCEKACEYDAIKVVDQLAHVDYDKCVMCGECVKKCPTKVIKDIRG